jgi:hypothetical protein
MITIVVDLHAYQSEPPDALPASSAKDYVHMRSSIRRALDEGRSLTVYVTDPLLLHWLADLVEYDGIEWRHVAPETDYRRVFGEDPSPPFTPDLIIALDLAGINAPPLGSTVDPAGWVLGERLHPLWAAAQGSPAHLAHLLGWVLKNADKLEPHLLPLIQRRLAVWARDEAVYAALRAGSLATDTMSLLRCAALQRYDTAWLLEHGLAHLPPTVPALDGALWAHIVSDLAVSIEHYWRERIARATVDTSFVRAAIAQMSGWSDVELRVIESILQREPQLLDEPLLHAVRQRFNDLPEAAATLDELGALVPPAQPALPHDDWNDAQWLRWATDDYMPYFTWSVRAAQPRAHQQACALAYETWLARRYPLWLASADMPLITRQFTQLRDVLDTQADAVVVWLVVDGLTWWQGRVLREYCRHQGLYPQRYEPGIALLPSLTDISKRALVTGVPVAEPPRGSIAQAAREKLERVGIHAGVGYDARQIMAALRGSAPPRCLLWFANRLDRLAHERQDFADDGMVRAYLEELARNLARIRSSCTERGLRFHALIGSDHGSTLLPSGAPTRHLPQATREVLDVWEDATDQPGAGVVSARAAQVGDTHRFELDQTGDWHYLARVPYQLPHDYLVPRGYAALGRRPAGWTHGGLTPEETIVPLMHLTPEPLVVERLSVTLTGQVRVRQDSVLEVLVVNSNAAPIDTVVLRIADIAPVTIAYVAAATRYQATVTLPARPIEGNELMLRWELEGCVLGVEHRQQGEARLPVRRLQSEDRFDDLFG